MHAIIVSCVFPPEPNISAQTSAHIAEGLVQRGHSVTVIAPFPSRPGGKPYPGHGRRLFRRGKNDLVFDLIRCFSIPSRESRLLSRFLENLSFGLTSGLVLLTARRADVVYANTWPIVASGIVAFIARLRNIPLVVSVQDVYPDSMIAQRRMEANALPARWMRRIDKLIACGSKAVIVISESFAAIYRKERGVALDRLHVVPNWVNGDSVHPNDDGAVGFREKYGIPQDAFVVLYGGNVGVAAGVETVVESFHYLKPESNVYLLIAGEGSNLTACQALARDIGCERIFFHAPWLARETSSVLGAADLLILPTRGRQSMASVPSKIVSYMLAARPILALALSDTDLAEIVERSGCGWVIEPDNPELLAAKIKQIAVLNSAERICRGEAGRRFALANLTREACLPRVIDLLQATAVQGAR